MTGETSPDGGWWVRAAAAASSLAPEEQKIHKGVDEKCVHHVTHPVGRTLPNYLPQISSVQIPDKPLRHQNGGKPHDEDSHVQHPEKRSRCHTPSHNRTEMNPKTEEKSVVVQFEIHRA